MTRHSSQPRRRWWRRPLGDALRVAVGVGSPGGVEGEDAGTFERALVPSVFLGLN